MPGLDARTVARLARDAGFAGNALVTAVAVAQGESGHDPDALGDTTITTGTWGPSVGLWQIRSLRAETGTGKPRDANRLRDPAFNAASAYSISSSGTNWRPWSVYTSGAYRQHLGAARQAVADIGAAPAVPTGIGGALLGGLDPLTVGGALVDGLDGAGGTIAQATLMGALAPFGLSWLADPDGRRRGTYALGAVVLAVLGVWILFRAQSAALAGDVLGGIVGGLS